MDKIRKSFRSRKKDKSDKSDKIVLESSKPSQWQEDEKKVREGSCSFQVKYLGSQEVFESRGIHVCEDAVKVLKAKNHRSVWSRMSMRKRSEDKAKGKSQRAILYVTGDALRVVDEISKGLIVDQTVEKVSFCAPDRNHDKAFAYICRDGTSRRWLCHAFVAIKESGERLSHAVGCAFAICLEKKVQREKESVEVTFNTEGTSFTRNGSFRPATLTERLADPQSAILAEPVPKLSNGGVVTASVERPHATDNMLQKQASFRGFTKLSQSLPFKRQGSLRLGELPSTLERQQAMWTNDGFNQQQPNGRISPILESPTQEKNIGEACQKLTQGLSALTTDDLDPFSNAPFGSSGSTATTAQVHVSSQARPAPPTNASLLVSNPWQGPPAQSPVGVPEADKWLHSVASSVSLPYGTAAAPVVTATASPFQSTIGPVQPVYQMQTTASAFGQPTVAAFSGGMPVQQQSAFAQPVVHPAQVVVPTQVFSHQAQPSVAYAPTAAYPSPPQPTVSQATTFSANWPQSPSSVNVASSASKPVVPSSSTLPHNGTAATHSTALYNGSANQSQPTAAQSTWTSFNGTQAIGPTTLDPFDVAWASKAAAANNNNGLPPTTAPRSFHVNL